MNRIMRIDGNNSFNSLNQIQRATPTEAVQSHKPIEAVEAVKRREVDSYKFESIQKLDELRQQIGEALKKLEINRKKLVAVRTNVPIHFEQQQIQKRPTNTQMAAYLKFVPAPADVNESATQQQSHEQAK